MDRKGQATLEFLFSFAAIAAVVAILTIAIMAQNDSARARAEDMRRIAAAESAARAVEAALFSGTDISFDFEKENISYRVESGRMHVDHQDKVIEIGGVFIYDSAEPV